MKKHFFLTVIIIVSFFILPIDAFVKIDGINVESSRVLNNGEMQLDGNFIFNQKIQPKKDIKIDVYSMPFDFKFGLTKGREAGFFLQIDSQKADINNQQFNSSSLAKIGINAKMKVMNNLSAKLSLGYSPNGKTYFSSDGIAVKPEILYDYPLQVGVLFSNIGYEYADGKYTFGNDTKVNMSNRLTYGIGYYYPAMQNYILTIEWIGGQKYAKDFENVGALYLGMKYKIDPEIILVGNVGFATANGSPDLTVRIGFNKYFGMLKASNEYLNYRWRAYDRGAVARGAVKKTAATETLSKYCKTCDYVSTGNERFCPHDGTLLVEELQPQDNKCAVCSNELPENSNFCPYCGAKTKRVITFGGDEHLKKTAAKPTGVINELEEEPLTTANKSVDLDRVSFLLEDAKKSFDKENYDQAIRNYVAASKLDSKNHKIWYNLGVTYFFTKQYADAKNSLERALKINSKDVDTLLYLGAVNGMLKNKNDAVRMFKRVLDIEPNNEIARRNLQKLGFY